MTRMPYIKTTTRAQLIAFIDAIYAQGWRISIWNHQNVIGQFAKAEFPKDRCYTIGQMSNARSFVFTEQPYNYIQVNSPAHLISYTKRLPPDLRPTVHPT